MKLHANCRSNWYAIQVRPRFEFSAAKILHDKGFELFVPSYKSLRSWSDRKVELELPLFPGYIFCRFDATIRLQIMITAGVVRIVGAGKMPLPLETGEIEAVKKAVRCGCRIEPHPFVAIGSQVCIEKGPLAGVTGIVQGEKNRHLILSIALVQQSILVEVDSWIMRVIKPYEP